MATKIEWTRGDDGTSGETWNPVAGCTWASPGCDNCYAATMTRRLEAMGQEKYAGLTTKKHFNGVVRTVESALTIPLKWKKPRRVFVNSMSDLFHKDVPFEFIDKVFAVMALCPQHTFQVLTKRPERMATYLTDCRPDQFYTDEKVQMRADEINAKLNAWPGWPLPNVWLGTSVENQDAANSRIPHLMRTPAAIRFLSVEPLIGPVDLNQINCSSGWVIDSLCGWWWTENQIGVDAFEMGQQEQGPSIDWVIAGGESGPKARPCNVDWIRSIVKQCHSASVPCFVKQLGAQPRPSALPSDVSVRLVKDKKGGDWDEWPEDLRVREFPKVPVSA